ncbi:MAG: alpha/beta hydrolase [Gemmatimonadetes bacterium]|nr:alpha/beta hydrolase [Gemmatimonadota bacterium]
MDTIPDPLQRNAVTITGAVESDDTLVFLHGFGNDQTVWSAVAPSFAATHRLVLLDNVGSGRSDAMAYKAHRYMNLQRWADDLVEVLQALKLRRAATLVGHSVGGAIGMLAAVTAPSLVRQLAVLGMSPRYREEDGLPGLTERDVDLIYGAVINNYESWTDTFAAHVIRNADRPALAAQFASCLRQMSSRQALTTLQAILTSDLRALVPRVEQRVLLLQSRDDAFVPREVAEYLHRAIRHSELVVLDAEGHHPHLSAPQAVTAALRGFLA